MLTHDLELEEAEDTAAGDFLDYITPANISRMRFKTHHGWFEEVFSSLHSINHILPEELGFGLVGELGDLTKDILKPPSLDYVKIRMDESRSNKPIDKDVEYKHLDSEKMAEFEKRVSAFVEQKQQEMDQMKESHAKMMSKINKGKFYLDAEELLKNAGLDSEKVNGISLEVESKMGISLADRNDVVCIQPGPTHEEDGDDKNINGNGNFDDINANGLVDSAAGLLDEFTSGDQTSPAEGVHHDGLDLMEDINMDVDIPIPPVDAVQAITAPKTDDEWVVVENQAQQDDISGSGVNLQQASGSTDAPAATLPTSTALPVTANPPPDAKPQVDTITETVADEAHEVHGSNGETGTPADDMLQAGSMFEGADFDSFEHMGGTSFDADDAGDGLLDFGGGFGGEQDGVQ
jgi:SWI/SNF-RSC chromatin remodeling complexes subunit Ssr4-like protein